jgi:hypothetical protein
VLLNSPDRDEAATRTGPGSGGGTGGSSASDSPPDRRRRGVSPILATAAAELAEQLRAAGELCAALRAGDDSWLPPGARFVPAPLTD